MNAGKYIVIEGNDGTGKSTQVSEIRKLLNDKGIESVEFHEPAGVPVADAIRTVIKDGSLERSGETNLLLFTAARNEIWRRAAQELASGVWVIAARNYYSTLAYQGYGEGLSIQLIEDTTRKFTNEEYCKPDLAVILRLDNASRGKRIAERGALDKPDTFESRTVDFQTKVNQGYLEIASTHNLQIIDANRSVENVRDDIWQEVEKLLET